MEDNLFDNIKKSSLEQNEFQMPDNALADFKKYQNNRDFPNKRSFGTYALIGTMLLLLLGSNLYWLMSQSENSTQPIKYIQTETLKTDTVFITQYINSEKEQKEGIASKLISENEYLRLMETRDRLELLEVSMSQLAHHLQYLENSNKSLANNIAHNSEVNRGIIKRPTTDLSVQPILEKESRKTNSFLANLENLVLDNFSVETRAGFPKLDELAYIKVKNQSFLNRMMPSTFSVFGQAGLYFEKGNDVSFLPGKHFNLGVSAIFFGQFRAKLGLLQSNSNGEYESDEMRPNNISFAAGPENAKYDELDITSKSTFAMFGLDYLLKGNKLFTPYFGMYYNIGDQQYTDLEYKYIFENEDLRLRVSDSEISRNQHLGFDLGTNISLIKNFDTCLSINYNFKLKGNIESVFTINTGLQYEF